MDFDLSEHQEVLRTTARDFLKKECPMSLVREAQEDEKGYPPELWHKIAQLGWLGLVLPEEYGGSGGDFLDLVVLLEEMGRALMPGPFLSTVVLGALPILAAGTAEQKNNILPGIAEGKAIMTMALTEPKTGYNAGNIEVRAVSDNNDYIINGTKLFVPYAHIADNLLCVARTGGSSNPEEGITLFGVEKQSPGMTCTPLKTLSLERQCEVIFDQVRVPRGNILGKPGEGWKIVKKILQHAAIAECAMMLGAARRVFEMTIDYVKERTQFGKPIGSLQVVQHKCADMASDVEGSKYITYQAAWKLSRNIPCASEVSMAKAWVNEACSRTCEEACHLHGAMGYTRDHDAPLYLKQVRAAAFNFGDTIFHQELVARQFVANA